MQAHSAKSSQIVGVALTFIIEVLFSFLAGWAMYDEFSSWGFVPAILVGALSGLVFLLLGLYVFILREYAIDANKVFAKIRNESAGGRIAWAFFLVFLVAAIESFINANRMVALPIPDVTAKVFLWLMFQCLVFVPLALGKLVHGHVNATDPEIEERGFYSDIDSAFYQGVRKQLPGMTLREIAQLRQGNAAPLAARIQAKEQAAYDEEEAANTQHPLAQGLKQLEIPEVRAPNGAKKPQ